MSEPATSSAVPTEPIPLSQADPSRDLDVVRSLWSDYLTWVNAEVNDRYGISFEIDEILERNLADLTPFQPPGGRLLLAGDVGIGCLQSIGEEVGEIKRLYVHPDARGTGLGRRLLEGLLEAADDMGHRRVRLDSVRFMQAAHSLYHSAGFVEIGPYEQSEIPPEVWDLFIDPDRHDATLGSSGRRHSGQPAAGPPEVSGSSKTGRQPKMKIPRIRMAHERLPPV